MKFGPLPPVAKTAAFFLRVQITGAGVAVTRFHMKYTNSLSATDANTLLNTLATSWTTRFAPITGTAYTLVGTAVNDLDSRTGVEVGLVTSHPGTAASQGGQAATSFVVSAKTALKYRGGHSRVYLPGISISNLADSNSWSTAAQGTVFTAWTGMLADLATSPPVGVGAMSQVVVRYISSNKADFNPVPPTLPALLNPPMVLPITSWVTNPQVGSQRRRNQQ